MDGAGPDDAAGTASRDGSRKSYDAFISSAHDADGAFAPVLRGACSLRRTGHSELQQDAPAGWRAVAAPCVNPGHVARLSAGPR
jgi:hypothetical protein